MKPYPEYKPTGLAWLPEIPKHWDVVPLAAYAKEKSITNQTDLELLSVYLDRGVIRFSEVSAKRTNVTSEDLSKYQRVDVGDLVLNNQQAWRGSVGVSPYTGIVSPAYIVLELSDKLHKRFANYLFRDNSMVTHYAIASKGIGSIQRNLYWINLKRKNLFLPPFPEQAQIVRYLDAMTAKINKLIRAKKRQIALLQEQKQNMISTAMTYDPHSSRSIWKKMRLKHTTSVPLQYGANAVGIPFDENETRYIRITDIDVHGNLKNMDKQSLPQDIGKEYALKDGDILFARCGGTVGKTYLYHSEDGMCCYAGYLIRYRPNKEIVLPDYIYLYTQSSIYKKWLQQIFIQATIQNVSAEKYNNLTILIPSLEEQKEIVFFLHKKLNQVENVIRMIENLISSLVEYKNSLISSVVTGQVDVRNIAVEDVDPTDLITDDVATSFDDDIAALSEESPTTGSEE